jgi:hypothetical protein
MPYYRLYHVKDDNFAGVDDFEAEDVQACRHATSLNGTATAELSSGKRKNKGVQPGGTCPPSLPVSTVRRSFELARSGERRTMIEL